MKKKEMVHKNQVQHVKAERDVLAKAKNPCIVNLRSSFQDDNYLYLIMDYLPGGDLMTLLMRKDILSEEESRFYIAEMVGIKTHGRFQQCKACISWATSIVT